jgi:hypothetical protein
VGTVRKRKVEMKKLCLAIAIVGMMVTRSLFASMEVTLYQDTGSYSYGNGGEFRAVGNADLNNVVNWAAYRASTASQGAYFQTFCIEDSEYFYPGTTYAASTGNNALYGAVGSSPGTPVTMGTAWLYSQFAAGTLGAYHYAYGGTRTPDAGAVQQAIWYFQGETVGAHNAWAVLAEANVANAFAAANGAFGVQALTLGAPGQVQDQLVIVVPEPTTVIAGAGALALALLGIGGARRSRVVHLGN